MKNSSADSYIIKLTRGKKKEEKSQNKCRPFV